MCQVLCWVPGPSAGLANEMKCNIKSCPSRGKEIAGCVQNCLQRGYKCLQEACLMLRLSPRKWEWADKEESLTLPLLQLREVKQKQQEGLPNTSQWGQLVLVPSLLCTCQYENLHSGVSDHWRAEGKWSLKANPSDGNYVTKLLASSQTYLELHPFPLFSFDEDKPGHGQASGMKPLRAETIRVDYITATLKPSYEWTVP